VAIRRPFLLLAAGLAASCSAGATTYLVRPDGTGDFPTIQAAVYAAVAGDVIELASGTFMGLGNRDVDYLEKAITIRSQSGDPRDCIVDCEGSPSEMHRGFRLANVGSGGVLEGITVKHGYQYDGGGVFLLASAATIRRCILSENTARQGAGIFCDLYDGPTISECTIAGNHATIQGGGLCI